MRAVDKDSFNYMRKSCWRQVFCVFGKNFSEKGKSRDDSGFLKGVSMGFQRNSTEHVKYTQRPAPEILAPAGSYDSFRAALLAGADAVYAGGPQFGARAYAKNFTEEQLADAIDEAHLHGRRFYLTVNTLVKDKELPELLRFLFPLYEKGLDAVIVQDAGVFELVRTCFPEMEIHASTQMTVAGAGGARFLKECGAVRVVPARELSLEEIRHLKRETGMEVECFVHGALCYCYSGQCLMSSLIGGRSGNRGQCAQPCRLPYSAGAEKGFLLSLKDICTLEILPDLIEAGIDSFKIEGRMKRPEYVAGVTSMYRKYVDQYMEKGRKGFHVEARDLEMLQDLYNRGGFHTGYYGQKNGREMLSTEKPNHTGTVVGKVKKQNGRTLEAVVQTEIQKGDVIELAQEGAKRNYTFGSGAKKGDVVRILLPGGVRFAPGAPLYRIRSEERLTQWREFWQSGKIQEKIYGFLSLISEKPATLVVCCGRVCVEVHSDLPVEAASRSPLDETRLRRQIQKTGNTAFQFAQLDIEMEPDVFLPMQQINLLRRRALERLSHEICGQSHRSREQKDGEEAVLALKKNSMPEKKDLVKKTFPLCVLVTRMEQLEAVCECGGVFRVYVESSLWEEETEDFSRDKSSAHGFPRGISERKIGELLQGLKKNGVEVYLAMPHIFREKTRRQWEENAGRQSADCFDGILVRNYESVSYWQSIPGKGQNRFDKPLILDHNLYVMNQSAKAFWKHRGIHEFTVPVELNRQEIRELGVEEMELQVYGYLPVMISAQCIGQNVAGCKGSGEPCVLTDRYQNRFPVEKRCRECYNVIYNSVPLCLFDEKKTLEIIAPGRLRLQFSVEDGPKTRQILEEYRQVFEHHGGGCRPFEPFTHGHFRRGVI